MEDRGAQFEDPCALCGIPNLWCLYEINTGRGRCCPSCGIIDSHRVLEKIG